VLRQNSFISTGFKSTAILSLGDSTLIVRPLTRLSLGELLSQPGQDSIRVNLRAGRVRVQVKPPTVGKVDFVVRSPTATASVRGTVFDFDTSNLTVYAGRVDFSTASAPGMAVNAGSISMVDEKTRTVTPPVATQALSPTPPLETAALGAAADAAASSIRSGGSGSGSGSGSASDGGIAVGVNW
jgi:hypothetical protein